MQKFPNYQQVALCDNADSINIRSFAHVAWHLFILAGVGCHFMAVKLLVGA